MSKTQVEPVIPPYNPWSSYLVEASAGSGKTWQLSRRFLALVVAGADPSSILTVTFTRKAAAEMRERIIHDAVLLGEGDKEFSGFVEQIRQWQREQVSTAITIRTADEASRLILEKTQTLRITTIDALFMQWVQQFPLETAISGEDSQGSVSLQSPWQLLSSLEQQRLEQRAWNSILAMTRDHQENRELMQSISVHAPNGSIKQLSRAIAPITHCDTFLWSVALSSGEDPARYHKVPQHLATDEEFIAAHQEQLKSIINLVTNTDKRTTALECLSKCDFPGLIRCQIINSKKDSLSGTTFRSAAAKDHPAFRELSEALLAWDSDAKLAQLNDTARLLWSLYGARARALHRLKSIESLGTFSDAVKGVSLMATEATAMGARAMAWGHIRHLMLDEFQDTSKLQWMIFERLARELLAGSAESSSPGSSVFIVGDKKQSIYRFREADPSLMAEAKSTLSPLGLKTLEMSESYRSCSAVLDLVNAVFSDQTLIQDFPRHAPAGVKVKSAPSRSSYGSVTIYPEAAADAEQGSVASAYKSQAEQIAEHILRATDGTLGIRVFDDDKKIWRLPSFSDFAVLYPKKTHAHMIEDALRARGIPCQKEERHGFFDRPEIVDLRALVTWLTWSADTVALCTILRSPICQLSDRDLQVVIAEGPDRILSRLKTEHPGIFKLLMDLRAAHQRDSMSKIIGYLLTENHLTARYERAFGPIEGPLARANILKWFDMVRSQSAEDALDAQSWTVAMDEAAEEDETGNATLAANAVSLMTIHKSKGLEFPCVVISDLASDWHKPETGWLRDSRPGREGLWYIGNDKVRPRASKDFNELLKLNEIESRDEKGRLLYVALTRASTHLVLTGATPKKPLENSYLTKLSIAAAALSHVTTEILPSGATMYKRGEPTQDPIAKESAQPDRLKRLPPEPSMTGRPALLILTPSSNKASQDQDDIDTMRAEILAQQTFSPDAGKAFGTLVHKLIENHVINAEWSDRKLLRLVPQEIFLTENIDANYFLDQAKSQVQALLDSDVWKSLIHSADQILSEVPLAGIEGEYLFNAKADLIIRRRDQSISVVDYKTIELSPNLDDSKLKSICQELGYSDQVLQYCRLAKKALNAQTVNGLLLFTKTMRIVEVT